MSIAVASGILFTNIFNSMVIAAATDSNLPDSVVAGREYFRFVNPGDFFKIFSPASQVLTLFSLILFWKDFRNVRLLLGIALLCFVASDILAFTYFHPRTEVMFSGSMPDTATLKRLSSEWSTMNWFRSFIVLIGVLLSFLAVDKIYASKQGSRKSRRLRKTFSDSKFL